MQTIIGFTSMSAGLIKTQNVLFQEQIFPSLESNQTEEKLIERTYQKLKDSTGSSLLEVIQREKNE